MPHFDPDRGMTEEQVERYFARHAADVERLRAGDLSAIDDLLWYWNRDVRHMTQEEIAFEMSDGFEEIREAARRWLLRNNRSQN